MYLDTSVLVAALVEDETHHEACLHLPTTGSPITWSHSIAEVFAALTGGRLGLRVAPATARDLLRYSIAKRIKFIELSAQFILKAIESAESVGARGGAMYDYLHLVAAKQANASQIFTLNAGHFIAPRTKRYLGSTDETDKIVL